MPKLKTTRALLWAMMLTIMPLVACAQSSQGQTAPADTEAVKTRVIEYMTQMFPNLADLKVEELGEDPDGPFLKGTVSFNNRGREQRNEIFVTRDGRHLILGQIFDLDVEPMRARWNQLRRGAEERAAEIDLANRPFKGKDDASVVVVEFSDYQCPFCSRAYETLEGRLVEAFGDKIKFVFKHLPLESLHPWARKASVASACAYEQNADAFWGMHSSLFENQKTISVENLRDTAAGFAEKIGIDKDAFLACYDTDQSDPMVAADLAEAEKLGIRSTPTFLINGALVSGAIPFEEFSAYINYALEDAAGSK